MKNSQKANIRIDLSFSWVMVGGLGVRRGVRGGDKGSKQADGGKERKEDTIWYAPRLSTPDPVG